MNRHYPDMPLTGVGAIIFRDDSVLLVKRGTHPSLGKWSIPGGLVELGESLDAAVRREILEEVGLDVHVVDLVAALDRVMRDREGRIEYHYILLDFLCTAETGNPAAATDAAECRFVPLEQLSSYDMTTGTEKVIRRALAQAGQKGLPIYDAFV